MVKTTKRSRKFTKTGGVHKRIEKGGTITKKGKLRLMNRKHKTKLSKAEQKELDTKIANKEAAKVNKQLSELTEQEKTRQENDFLGVHNLKDLDMDAFLNAAVNDVENNQDDDENEDDDISMESESESESDQDEEKEKKENEESNSMDSDQKSVDSDMDNEQDLDAAEKQMTERLKKLESDDPEFHKFLKDNDSSLLQFGKQNQDDDPNESDDDDDNDDNDNEKDEDNENEIEDNNNNDTQQQTMEVDSPSSNTKILDRATLKKIEKSAFDAHGIKGLKRFVLAYKIACHLSDTNQEELDSSNQLYQIESSAVFDRLMVISLTRFHEAFHYHLIGKGSGLEQDSNKSDTQSNEADDDKSKETTNNKEQDENVPINPRHLAKSKNWKDLKKILQAFFKSTNHLLKEVKESKLLTFIIRCLSKYIRYLTPFPMIAKNLLQTLTTHWCAPFQNESDHIVRLHAFLRIRQLALTQPFPFIEDCLKVLYLAYAKAAKFLTESSLPTLTFLGNCLVELYSLDIDSSYQHAFIYIRQLALHLRTALQKKTKESFQVIYCWQYFNCLKVWTAILAANPAENELLSLFYPLTEIILGVSRLLPSTRHLPLRLHCVRLLQQLAAASEMFIPTTPILFEALDLKELYMKPKKTSGKKSGGGGGSTGLKNSLRLPLVLKLPKEDTLRTSDQLDP